MQNRGLRISSSSSSSCRFPVRITHILCSQGARPRPRPRPRTRRRVGIAREPERQSTERLTELDIHRIEPDGVDDRAEVRVRERALRRGGHVVLLARAARVRAQLRDEGRVVRGAAAFDVQVDSGRCERSRGREVEGWSRGRGVDRVDSRHDINQSTNQIQIPKKIPKKSQNQLHNSTTNLKISKSQNLKDSKTKKDKDKIQLVTYPSRTAAPNGRGRSGLAPPRKRSQIVSANACACASDVKPTAPVAPPRLRGRCVRGEVVGSLCRRRGGRGRSSSCTRRGRRVVVV